ncbi:ferritin-like domain-containing protein [Shimazuella sp. AN120528]|nr:ferritin-like domain-containing protein [Shimazuella soli]
MSSNGTIENREIVKDLQKAINGEYSAIICYRFLETQAKEKTDRIRIEEIRKDEERHLSEMSRLYFYLTGRNAKFEQSEKCAATYQEGLVQAFDDEQETVDFYNEIADKASSKYTKRVFRRAALDEQNHAVWFLRMVTKNKY